MDKIDLKNIKIIVYDFDGVMTDNRVYLSEDGKETVVCNRTDGLAVGKIKELGLKQFILSMETNPVVRHRALKLGLDLLQGVNNKEIVLKDFCQTKGIALSEVMFVGNDLNDIGAMRLVGYPVAPSDANPRVKEIAKYVLAKKGGEGVVMEVFENLLAV